MKSNVFLVFGAKKEVVDQKNNSETVRELAPLSGNLRFGFCTDTYLFFSELAPHLRYLAPQNRELAPQNVALARRFLKKRRIKFFEKR
jgi:hypothetical protein